MQSYPDLSTLNTVSATTRDYFLAEIATRSKYLSYFDGSIFNETLPTDEPSNEPPERFPTGINLSKMLCLAQADSLFGEWDEDIVTFAPRQDSGVTDDEKRAAELAQKILRGSNANSMLWEVALDREIYGGGVIQVSIDLPSPGHVRWSRIPVQSFFPIWDPEDGNKILECFVLYEITADQCKAKYGITPNHETAIRVEHWTEREHTVKVDDHRIDKFSGTNPWGIVPFVYIPRLRSTHWWGDSLIEDLIRPQNELNGRIADMGDSLHYNSHPIRYGFNLPKNFNRKNFPNGPDDFWDLGRAIGKDSPPPTVGMLAAPNPVPAETFDYLTFIYDWTRTSSFAPPVAFGEDSGGAQRSGATMEIRMWPLIKATRRSRSFMETGLSLAMKYSAIILQQKRIDEIPVRALGRLAAGDLAPRFAPVMPRDQAMIIDEVVKGLANDPPTISLETAVKKLGYGTSEVDRIKEMLKDDDLYARKEKMEKEKLEAQTEAAKVRGMNSAAGNAPNKDKEPVE